MCFINLQEWNKYRVETREDENVMSKLYSLSKTHGYNITNPRLQKVFLAPLLKGIEITTPP